MPRRLNKVMSDLTKLATIVENILTELKAYRELTVKNTQKLGEIDDKLLEINTRLAQKDEQANKYSRTIK